MSTGHECDVACVTEHAAESRRQAFGEIEQRVAAMYRQVWDEDVTARFDRDGTIELRRVDGVLAAMDAIGAATGTTKDEWFDLIERLAAL